VEGGCYLVGERMIVGVPKETGVCVLEKTYNRLGKLLELFSGKIGGVPLGESKTGVIWAPIIPRILCT